MRSLGLILMTMTLYARWASVVVSAFGNLPVTTRQTRTRPTCRPTTVLGPVLSQDEPSPLSYSEQSRKFRRDYYTHESWIKHRSKERFIGTIIKIFDSGVVRALFQELILVGGVAMVVLLYNALLVTGWDDFALVHHDPITLFGKDTKLPLMYLPLAGFTLSTSALSLLLGTYNNKPSLTWL